MRLVIMCEGQTESLFCKVLLAPHLGARGLYLDCPVVTTSKDPKKGRVFKGGVVNFLKLRNDIIDKIKEQPDALHTTMIDFYGLPNDFPGYEQTGSLPTAHQKVSFLEEALEQNIREANELQGCQIRFIPYLQLHEFEALLFCKVEEFDFYFSDEVAAVLKEQMSDFSSPEEINDRPEKAPSVRIEKTVKKIDEEIYSKTQHEVEIATLIGLDTMRANCPHFDQWLTRIETYFEQR